MTCSEWRGKTIALIADCERKLTEAVSEVLQVDIDRWQTAVDYSFLIALIRPVSSKAHV